MAILAIRFPGYDHDSGSAYGMVDNENSSGFNVPTATFRTSEQMTFDISSHSLSEGWFFISFNGLNDQDANAVILTLSGATQDLFRIICVDTVTSGGQQKAQYYNGSTWTDVATFSSNLTTSGATRRMDVHWKIADSGGEFTVYINGASEVSWTGDTLQTADTTIDEITISGCDASVNLMYWSPFIIADADTRGMEVFASLPTSDGNYAETTGSEANVDDWLYASGYSIVSAVGDANGERLTLNFNDISVAFSGYSVAAVAVGLAAKAQSEPGLHIKPLTRKSSTDYNPTGSFQPGSASIGLFAYTMLTDPATGSAWADQAAVNDTEFGLEMSSTA